MNVKKCDFCGKEIKGNMKIVEITIWNPISKHTYLQSVDVKYEICYTCYTKMKKILKLEI